MFHPSSKKILLAVLVASFVVQTGLVYSDDVDLVLSSEAVEGRRLYHEYACQTCHQLWGQGGFLGPDLTNAASRVDETRLVSLLTVGSGQMPALNFDERQIMRMGAFLREIDSPSVGRGQLRMGDPNAGTTPQAAFEAAVVDASPPRDVAAGFETFRSGICTACHFPFQRSIVGAPDLSTAVERFGDDVLNDVLSNGRPQAGMPPPAPALSQQQRSDLVAYLRWLNTNRGLLSDASDAIQAGRSLDWGALPWWEFR
jgi:nitric oxide reductase subunit C